MALHIINVNIFPCRLRHAHKRKHSALHYWSSSFWNHWIQHYARQIARCGERKRAFVPQEKKCGKGVGTYKEEWMDEQINRKNLDTVWMDPCWSGPGWVLVVTRWLVQTFLIYTNNKRKCMKACPGVSQALCMCECSLTLCSLLVLCNMILRLVMICATSMQINHTTKHI